MYVHLFFTVLLTYLQSYFIFQDASLPKLPVPTLEHTMERYLETMKPVLKPAQHDKLRKIIENFTSLNGLGPKLQLYLLNRYEKLDNWVIWFFN